MKILHVWNTAGVPQTIAKFQKKLGHDVVVISRKQADKFGIGKTAPEIVKLSSLSPKLFVLKVLLISRSYDVIHVHSLDKIVPLLKRIYPKKKVVLTYHGSDIRERWDEKKKYWAKANIVTVATEDLLKNAPENIIYVPNPVDTDIFNPRINEKYGIQKLNKALYIHSKSHPKSLEIIKKRAKDMGVELEVLERSERSIPYSEMPKFLSQFSLYFDQVDMPALSKTALECLALGIPVVNWEGKKITALPRHHDPFEVAKKWLEVYASN